MDGPGPYYNGPDGPYFDGPPPHGGGPPPPRFGNDGPDFNGPPGHNGYGPPPPRYDSNGLKDCDDDKSPKSHKLPPHIMT